MSQRKIIATGEAVVEKEIARKAKIPPKYKVVILNDDYTPMDFVTEILQKIFFMDNNTANELMLQVHTQGKAICGVYTRDVAQSKVAKVNDYARRNKHPLLCKLEAE